MSSSAPILVVEDDLELRRVVCDVLEQAGHVTITADHGRAALDLLLSGTATPSLILLDLRMPVMDGWEFARVARCYARFAHIPIVIVSTPAAGPRWHPQVNGVLPKPFTPDALLDEVARHLPEAAVAG
jgi:CheY-like chemotaxis protein